MQNYLFVRSVVEFQFKCLYEAFSRRDIQFLFGLKDGVQIGHFKNG
jgi:hypothetical protein